MCASRPLLLLLLSAAIALYTLLLASTWLAHLRRALALQRRLLLLLAG
jgi:hypothetical protein